MTEMWEKNCSSMIVDKMWQLCGAIAGLQGKTLQADCKAKLCKQLPSEQEYVIFPSLTVSKRQNSCKSRIYGLCGCLFVCIDVCYIFVFVLVVFFVFEIIPRMEAFDINSKSVLNPNEL